MIRGWGLIEADFAREYQIEPAAYGGMSSRRFGVLLSGLSGESLYRQWSDKQPREAVGDAEAIAVFDRMKPPSS